MKKRVTRLCALTLSVSMLAFAAPAVFCAAEAAEEQFE